MTFTEWRSNIELAEGLRKLLEDPIMKMAIDLLEKNTAASTLGNGSGLLQLSDKATVLFGYDAGRASLIYDLKQLASAVEEQKVFEPNYTE